MTTKQNDAALTDEQLDAVAGGFDIGPVGLRLSNPTPHPSPFIIVPDYRPRPPMGPCRSRGRAGIINPDSM